MGDTSEAGYAIYADMISMSEVNTYLDNRNECQDSTTGMTKRI